MNFKKEVRRINQTLGNLLPSERKGILARAMRYGVLGPGKRFRPLLTLAACRAVGGKIKEALPVACAVELIHACTLIHDDLPAMDDDDFRRGRPTCHRVFGEDIAILAGDALYTLAFEVIAEKVNARKAALVIKELASSLGISGVAGGQVLDLRTKIKNNNLRLLKNIYQKKTGALIRAAVRIGGIMGGASYKQMNALTAFAEHVGFSFQITDDLLDKGPYHRLFGLRCGMKIAEDEREKALRAIGGFGPSADALRQLAKFVLERKN